MIRFKITPKIFFPLLFLLFAFVAATAQQNNLTLKGVVTNAANGNSLAGATVRIKGRSIQTLSNEKGEFTLSADQKLPVVISISFLSYQTEEIMITNTDFITARLREIVTQLEDVVVSSGYVLQNKNEFTGAASHIAASQLKNKPALSFDQLLGGQATGIDIIQPTNILNNTPILRIRGINTINSSLYPLVVVDGVTVFTGGIGGNIGNNPLSDINPNDIESIDVLKDASAAAIYGSRAANGVIVITTRKGKKGKTKVNYDGWFSVSTPYNLPELLNAEQYTMIKNEAMVNAGKQPGFALMKDADSNIVNTNWYDVAYHPGLAHNHNLNLSGANDATSYFFSLGYTDQNNFIRNNTFKRYVARLNISHHISDNILFGANVSYSNSMNVGPNTGAIATNSDFSTYNTQYIGNEPLARMTYVLPPNVPVYNSAGGYSIQNGTSVGYGANIPSLVGTINAYNLKAVQDLDVNSSENNSLIGNAYAEWCITKKLKFRTSFGINNLQVVNKSFLNPINGDGASSNGAATNIFSKYLRTDWVNTLAYNKTWQDKHHLNILLGTEYIKKSLNAWGAQETNLTDPFYSNYQGGWINTSPIGNVLTQNRLVSYFSNLTYDFDKKYLLSVNVRRDGLSALSAGNKFGNFGGGSVGWNMYEENFYQNSSFAKVISNLKIRASYGIVGNSEIGDYPAIGTYSSATYGGLPTLYYSQTSNPDLKWEKSIKTDLGLSFSVLHDKVNVEFGYYNNNVDGLILKAPQSPSAGIPGNTISTNAGSLYNRGIELGINASLISHAGFKWTANFNFSTLKNKVTSLVSDVYIPSIFGVQNMTRVGYSIGSIFAVPTTGVNPDNGYRIFINSAGESVQYNHIGSPKWTYLDGSPAPAIDNYKDGVIQGPSLPTYFGGFNNSFAYKNFDLNIGITFSGGNKLYNGTRATISDQRYFNNGTFILDRWTKPGQVTDIQKLIYGDNVSAGFSFTNTTKVEDGSYVKLKNISLGYSIPDKILRGKVASAHVYLQAANLITLTKYRGADPEVSINGNSINSGKDQNVPPNARVFTVGINVGF